MGMRLAQLPTSHRDLAAVQEVLELRRRRSKDFFDEIAGRYESLTEPGGGWRAVAFALGFAFSGKTVADIGCGEGELSLLLARFAERVISVDLSEQMLAVLTEKAVRFGCERKITTKQGGIEQLPLEDASVDAVLMSQVLHHAAQPQRAVAEAARVLRPGGKLILLDLASHDREWVREQWADQWFGFHAPELESWLKAAGLSSIQIEVLPGNVPEMPVLIAVAGK
jgi:ArsR family transcriptional regulator